MPELLPVAAFILAAIAELIIVVAAGFVLWAAATTIGNVGDYVAPWAVVGAPLSGAFYWVRDLLMGWVNWANGQIEWQKQVAANTWVWAEQSFFWGFFSPWAASINVAWQYINNHTDWINYFRNWQLTWVEPNINSLWGWVTGWIQPSINNLWDWVQSQQGFTTGWIIPSIDHLWDWLNDSTNPQLDDLQRRVRQLQRQLDEANNSIVQADNQIQDLQKQLQTKATQQDMTQVQVLLQSVVGTIVGWAPLAVIADAGQGITNELRRIGTDPCNVCPDINLSDLEGRVAALEVDAG